MATTTPKSNWLLPQEMTVVNRLRKEGKSIKAIGKAIHRSDKAVAAYLRPIEERERKLQKDKKLFNSFAKVACENAFKGSKDFTAIMVAGITAQQDLFKNKELTKEQRRKKFQTVLGEMMDAFFDAAMQMAIMTFWTMPPKYKMAWLNMADQELEMMKHHHKMKPATKGK